MIFSCKGVRINARSYSHSAGKPSARKGHKEEGDIARIQEDDFLGTQILIRGEFKIVAWNPNTETLSLEVPKGEFGVKSP
jgi:hypothetical protein